MGPLQLTENLAQKDKLVDDELPIQDQQPELEFEFEFVTPQTPNSPADQLFLNGRLLPHEFPCPPAKSLSFSTALSRSVSLTSSVGSKDSLMSSRSSSTSSRSSSSASISTRTSISDVSERSVVMNRAKSLTRKPEVSTNWPILSPQHGSWHYVTQTPVLNRKESRKSRAEAGLQLRSKRKEHHDQGKRNKWFFWRFCRCFVSTCNEFHAIHP